MPRRTERRESSRESGVRASDARRTGVFGGSFDPVHLGHLLVADDVRAKLRLDRVLFVPALHPPHKPGTLAAYRHRRTMLELALRDWPGLEPCDIEAGRPGPSYTIDTLRALRTARDCGSLYLIVGADQYQEMPSWREPGELTRLARLVVVSRPGVRQPGRFSGHRPDRVRFREVIAVDISSALIRSRLANRRSVRYMLSVPVLAYVRRHRLYN